MRELEDEIALFELRSEQLLIHLQELPRGSLDAIDTRANLDTMMRRLVTLKAERDPSTQNRSNAAPHRTAAARRLPFYCGYCGVRAVTGT